jgi:very-long-chain (3R)-3-hydroxyacyl-CoA dehydratase
VLYRTLAHLFSAHPQQQQQDQRGAAAAAASLLAGLKAIPFIWVPSFVPTHLVPLYQRACTAYDAVGDTTARVQSAAVLEVLHVLFGLVRSPLPTTAVQVASRLFSVWGIAARFPSVRRRRPPL